MTTDSARRTRRHRPNDPERPARIAEAAIEVVAERGVEGVTHRAVAARAGVPLGSTTYHFTTLDELLAVALRTAAERNIAALHAWEAALPDDTDLAGALADLVVRALTDQRPDTVVEYELYAAALHRPALRPASVAWDAALADVLTRRAGPEHGPLLAVALCGALMQGLLAESPPSRAQVVKTFLPALEGADRRPQRR